MNNIYTVNYMGGLGGEFLCSLLASKLSPNDNFDLFVTDKNRYMFKQDYPIRGFIVSHLIKLIGSGLSIDQYIKNQSYPIENRFNDYLIDGFIELYDQVKADNKQQSFRNLKDLISSMFSSDELMFIKLSVDNKIQLKKHGISFQYFFPGSTNIYLYTKDVASQMFVLLYIYKIIEGYSVKYQTADQLIEHMKYKYFAEIDLNSFIDTDYNVDVSSFYLGGVSSDLFKFAGIDIDPDVVRQYAEANTLRLRDTFNLDITRDYDTNIIEQKCFDFINDWYKQNR